MNRRWLVLLPVLMVLGASTVRSAGEPDLDFGVDGEVTTSITGNTDGAHAIALQPDGKIVVAGWAQLLDNAVSKDFAVLRYEIDGSLDTSFGTNGIATTNFSGFFDDVWAVAIQPDGKIIAGGRTGNSNDFDFGLVRYTSTGLPDLTFGPDNDGMVETNFFGANDFLFDLVLQDDTKFIAAGSAIAAVTNEDFALARYLASGELDSNFGTGGRVLTNVGGGNFNDGGRAAALQPDGKIVMVGFADTATDLERALARYNSDGSLDISFGSGGTVTTDLFGGKDVASGVALQRDGKIIVVGQTSELVLSDEADLVAARYLPNGTLDPSFGDAGNTVTNVGLFDALFDVAIQVDGKAVATGVSKPVPNGQWILVVRYRTDGTLDPAFGTNGIVVTNPAGNFDWGNAIALQADHKIVMAGEAFSSGGGTGEVVVARYLTDIIFVDGFESGDISVWSDSQP